MPSIEIPITRCREERRVSHYVYILSCSDGTLYTGYTTDVARRLSEHEAGTGAKYTRGRGPFELRHVESFDSRSEALSREYEIKSLSRAEKEQLIENGSAADRENETSG